MTEGMPVPAPAPVAYTVEEVERYVGAVAQQRAELEVAIVQARARIAEAIPLEDRIAILERRVGELLAARAATGGPDGAPSTGHEGAPQQWPQQGGSGS